MIRIKWLLEWIIGCRHKELSGVFTLKNDLGEKSSYVKCWGCGREFEYDWAKMKVGRRLRHE